MYKCYGDDTVVVEECWNGVVCVVPNGFLCITVLCVNVWNVACDI